MLRRQGTQSEGKNAKVPGLGRHGAVLAFGSTLATILHPNVVVFRTGLPVNKIGRRASWLTEAVPNVLCRNADWASHEARQTPQVHGTGSRVQV